MKKQQEKSDPTGSGGNERSEPQGVKARRRSAPREALRRYQEGLAQAVECYFEKEMKKGTLGMRDEALLEEFCSFIASGASAHCQRPARVSAFGRAAAKQFLPAEEGQGAQ